MCKLNLPQRFWARRIVRWLGFDLYPNYQIEDIIVRSCPGMVEYNEEYAQDYHIVNENEFLFTYYYNGKLHSISKELFSPTNTKFVKAVSKETFAGCPIVDSEAAWEKRFAESEAKMREHWRKKNG